jgi:glycosyltransferase involved in cell wall biosynthesis
MNKHYNIELISPIIGKRIAFIVYNYPLSVSTMILNAIELLSNHNIVDVYVSRSQQQNQPISSRLLKLVHYFPDFGELFFVRLIRFVYRKAPLVIRPKVTNWVWWVTNFDVWNLSRWLSKNASPRKYDIIIPIECFSLIAARNAFQPSSDIVYFNMELLDWADDNPLYSNKSALKHLEYEALKHVVHVMITSNNRGDIFSKINDYPRDKISVLPVVPMKRIATTKSEYFRERFGIDHKKILVIYSGNFQPWAQCLEIIDSMDSWPENVHLVMHTWNPASLTTPYFRKLETAAIGRPVNFSSEYIDYYELSNALSSADIGLLFYEAIDFNFTEILFSSNKMGEYLAADLPVICSPFPSLEEFINSEGIGIACSFDKLGDAIRSISLDIAAFRNRVHECRQKHFEFESYFLAAFGQYARQRELRA